MRIFSSRGRVVKQLMDVDSVDWRELATNFGLVLLSVCVVFAGLETALIIGVIEHEVRGEQITCYGLDDHRQFHPTYGWTGPPNTRHLTKATKFQPWNKKTYNDEGFRDTYNTDAETNIIVLGDSFTFGSLAPDNATYPHLLDRWTPNRAVRNYGKGGYGTGNQLLVYRDIGEELEHNTVILTYYIGNDMFDNVNDEVRRPQFAVTESGVKLVKEPRKAPNPTHLIQNEQLRDVIAFLKKNTETYPYLEPKVRRTLARIGLANPAEYKGGPPTGEELKNQTRLTRALVEAVADEAARNDAELIIVSIPSRGELHPDRPWRFTKSEGQFYWTRQRELLRNVSENRERVTYVPLKPVLEGEIEDGNRVYGIRNAHLDDYGYRVTARTTYNHLVEQGQVRDSNPDFTANYTQSPSSC